MKRRFEKLNIDGKIRYIVWQKDNIFSKWKRIHFTVEETGEELDTLDIDELMCAYKSNYLVQQSEELRKDINQYLIDKEKKDHENPYKITKYKGDTNCIEVISEAKSMEELSDGHYTFKDLYRIKREYCIALVNSGTVKAYKTRKYPDGKECFNGGWFIVVIKNSSGTFMFRDYYEEDYWADFKCEERDHMDDWILSGELGLSEGLYRLNRDDS